MAGYKHIFFDLDRTLWDFETNMKESLKEIFKIYLQSKLSITAGIFISHFNHINETLWKQYRQGLLNKEMLRKKRFSIVLENFDIFDESLAIALNEEYLRICPLKTALMPYTKEVLEYLFTRYNLYILTNGFKETQERKIQNCNLKIYFKKIITSEEIGYNKPRPEFFAFAVNSLNARKEECLMIGDDIEIDINGARNYGIDQVYFNPGNKKYNVASKFEIRTLKELMNIL